MSQVVGVECNVIGFVVDDGFSVADVLFMSIQDGFGHRLEGAFHVGVASFKLLKFSNCHGAR